MGIKGLGLSLLSMLAFAALTPAQGQIGLPGNSLQAGQPTTVTYSNADRAGELVLMKVENGEGDAQVLEIQLDHNGCGSEEFQVPAGWMVASFETNDASEVRAVELGSPGT